MSCLIWVTCSHIDESRAISSWCTPRDCHIWVTGNLLVWRSWLTHVCDMTHSCVWHNSDDETGRDSYNAISLYASRHTHERVMSHTSHRSECDMTHWQSRVPYMSHERSRCMAISLYASRHTHERVMSHTCKRHTYVWSRAWRHRKSQTYAWVCHVSVIHVTHIWVSQVTYKNESCHTHERVMSHTCKRHTYVWSRAWRHRSHKHMHECVMYQCFMSHTYEWVRSHTRMSHVTHMSESCHTHAKGTRMFGVERDVTESHKRMNECVVYE